MTSLGTSGFSSTFFAACRPRAPSADQERLSQSRSADASMSSSVADLDPVSELVATAKAVRTRFQPGARSLSDTRQNAKDSLRLTTTGERPKVFCKMCVDADGVRGDEVSRSVGFCPSVWQRHTLGPASNGPTRVGSIPEQVASPFPCTGGGGYVAPATRATGAAEMASLFPRWSPLALLRFASQGRPRGDESAER
jgi:hypothetical protein